MRISTATIFDSATGAMMDRQSSLAATQLQIATGKRVVVPSDDPAAAAEVVSLTSTQARVVQYERNLQVANARLGLTETTLGSMGSLLQRSRELALSAGSGTLDDGGRRAIASELRAQLDSLVALANTADPTGGYLFSGDAAQAAPYSAAAPGYAYNGDQGHLDVPVSDQLELRSTVNGFEVFQRVRTGNGVFATGADPANTGVALIDGGRVTDPAALTADSYEVRFSVGGSGTTWSVVNLDTSATVVPSQPYVSGQGIEFDGMRIVVSGAPADNDAFSVSPAVHRNVFDTLAQLGSLLEQSTATSADLTRVQQGIQSAVDHIDSAHERMLSVRAEVGARMQQADTVTSANADHSLDLQSRMSTAADLDYAKAVSDVARRQLALEAAQAAFARVTQRTLFDYL
jgi:flagellar hook-associated protein 3 FlgL